MKCITIDDEPLALRLINSFVEKVPFLELSASFVSALEALDFLRKEPSDLVFLDINMPDLNGLELMRSMPKTPAVIFTTAHQQYAVEGFDLDAIDYLLKPFSFERFLKAVQKAQNRNIPTQTDEKTVGSEDYIFIRVEHNTLKIRLKDICFVEGLKDYLKIHLESGQPILTMKRLHAMEEILQGKGFIRIHRSYIISIDKIESLRNNKVKVKGQHLPIGESYREDFFKKVVEGKI